MDCQLARELLLCDGHPAPSRLAAAGLRDHLAACEACRGLASEMARLDRSWRAIPLPDDLEKSRDEFLRRFRETAASKPGSRRRRIPARWAVAASLLLSLGLGLGLISRPRPALASADVVARLVDWNLSLAHAGSAGERGRIYHGRASDFAAELERSSLGAEDRELARSLLDAAPALVREPDPLVEADRFDDIADKLVVRMNRAATAGDPTRVDQSAALYQRVVELGIESKLEILDRSTSLNFDHQRRLERLVLRDEARMNSLVDLLEQVPDSSRKQIRRALGLGARTRKTSPTLPQGEGHHKGRGRKAGGMVSGSSEGNS